MNYVNAHGQPIDVAALKVAAKTKSRPRSDEPFHKGWLAAGFPPQQLVDAKADHQKKVGAAAESGRSILPWDEARYMRDAKPTKIRSKPYNTRPSAADACALAEQTGWKSCAYQEASKGKT